MSYLMKETTTRLVQLRRAKSPAIARVVTASLAAHPLGLQGSMTYVVLGAVAIAAYANFLYCAIGHL